MDSAERASRPAQPGLNRLTRLASRRNRLISDAEPGPYPDARKADGGKQGGIQGDTRKREPGRQVETATLAMTQDFGFTHWKTAAPVKLMGREALSAGRMASGLCMIFRDRLRIQVFHGFLYAGKRLENAVQARAHKQQHDHTAGTCARDMPQCFPGTE